MFRPLLKLAEGPLQESAISGMNQDKPGPVSIYSGKTVIFSTIQNQIRFGQFIDGVKRNCFSGSETSPQCSGFKILQGGVCG